MSNSHPTLTAAVTPELLMQWTGHADRDRLSQQARAALWTASRSDWLMGDIAAHAAYLGLQSLDWLATEGQAPSRTTEHQDSGGYWWFVWVLYRPEIQAGIEGLNAVLRLAHEQPGRFGAEAADVEAAHAWDAARGATEFDLPDPGGDGDSPAYVLCTLLALRRLLDIALADGLPVVHMRISFRA